MRHNRTPNTRNVTTQERNSSLLEAVQLFLRLANELVNLRHRLLECRKLDHCVRNLACPQRVQALVQSTNPLFLDNLTPALPQCIRIWRHGSLHADLDRLEGAERNIGEELSGGRGSEEDEGFRSAGRELLAVEVLEDLVEAILAGTLERVADKCGGPAEEDAAKTFFGVDHLPGFGVGFVELCVDLATAFYLGKSAIDSN